MRITFLEATNGVSLSKEFTLAGAKPYPFVKNVNSISYDVTDICNFYSLISSHANLGHCLLKGNVTTQLHDESRAGKVKKQEVTNLLVLDFDALTVPWHQGQATYTQADIQRIADAIVASLPKQFQNVTYIAQASASMGLKGSAISMHLFFALRIPLPPKSLKLWLQDLNYSADFISKQVRLSVNGQSLSHPLDISVADNSKLIFIAPPVFEDPTKDPFGAPANRLVLVKKESLTLDLSQLIAVLNPEIVNQKANQIKEQLRKDAGYKTKAAKVTTTNVNNRVEEVLVNPDRMSITFASTAYKPWVTCNINGGDSGAYYFNIERPTYMYNWKGEPIFEIEKADPDFYASIFDLFDEELEAQGRSMLPIVMRDFESDTLYNGLYDPNKNQFDDDFPLTPSSIKGVESFMFTHGRPVPEHIPDARIVFDPSSKSPAVNLVSPPFYVNMYRKTEYMMHEIQPSKPLAFGEGALLKDICPLIYTLIDHILGNGAPELERFVNWLAYIYQNKVKAGTAWVLTGTQGTGKGLFYNKVLRPLFGTNHVPMRSLQNIEEQFNAYMRPALFMIVDEFHMASSNSGAMKMADKLKNQITEPTLTIRAMRANQIEVPSYCNFIFLTNRSDALKIEDGDRRYNIAPRQEVMLEVAHPEFMGHIDDIQKELFAFAGVLSTFKVDVKMVRTPIINDAKERMRVVGLSETEEFFEAVKHGNVSYFADLLNINVTNVAMAGEILTAQRYVKTWIAESLLAYSILQAEHLRTVFHVMLELGTHERKSTPAFKKLSERNGLKFVRKRQANSSYTDNPIRGVEVSWKISGEYRTELFEKYFDTNQDKQLLKAVGY